MRSWNVLLWLLLFCSLGTLTPAAPPKRPQYKRIHQKALRKVLADDPSGAIAELGELDDAETDFLLTVANAQANQLDDASRALERALERGLPPGRFLAGPRELLLPLRHRAPLLVLADSHAHRLIHGPMVGATTATTAMIWVRTVRAARVEVIARTQGTEALHKASARTTAARDYTCVIRLAALAPNTTYDFEVRVNGRTGPPSHSGRLRTSPRKDEPEPFTLAFGGGAGFVPHNERAWNTIAGFEPRLLLLLGDNVYSDDPESQAMQRYCYYRRQSREEFRRLVARTSVYSIWDDHDFGTNDCWGGPAIKTPEWKIPVWRTFRNNWANPAYGGGEEAPGCWYTFSFADVDFFMLDGRYYRTDPKTEQPSMLGPVQKAWLKNALRLSSGTFKVISSPVPWDYRTKGDSLDTWNGFRAERDELFDFLHAEKIEGVILLSADRHRSDAWQIQRPQGYELYEFNSSRLTNEHVHQIMPEAIFSYNAKQSFGLVDFDTQRGDPQVRYRVVTIDGEVVHHHTVRLSQLSYR
jgi:alkaline phosphatase D